ncbi:MAG: MarR family transcriptional regulator [Planctomycetes bacterium]|nr:MarR family transcriptional regulator [Planctomycetota bacterium]
MASRVSIPTDAVDELHKALSVLSRTVTHILQDRAVEEALGVGISYSKVQVLRLLSRRGGQTSSQIARFLGIRRPSVTQITDALVRAGWITCRVGKQDGRESIHKLSDEGRRRFNVVRRQQRHLLRNTMRLADKRDVERWTTTLHSIAGFLARSDQGFKEYCLQCGAHADGTCVLIGGDADCPFLRRRDPKLTANTRGPR